LAGAAGRGVEREAMVGILAQAIDAAVGAERKLLLREQLGAARELRQQAPDLLQGAAVHAFALDAPRLVDQVPDGRGSLLMQVHLSLRSVQYTQPGACRPMAVQTRVAP